MLQIITFKYRASKVFIWQIGFVALMTYCVGMFFVYRYWAAASIYTMDDSFISFRYAEHLAHSGRAAWNNGEQSLTEGYTSLVWVCVMALVFLAKLEPVSSSKFLGVVFVFLSALSLSMAAATWKEGAKNWFAGFLTLLLFLSNGHLLLHLVSGMETALAILLTSVYGILMLFLTKAWGRLKLPDHSRCICLAAACVSMLASLNRPEFAAFAALSVLVAFFQFPIARMHILKYIVAPGVAMCALYGMIRLNIYGYSLPLPFYIKVGSSERFAGLQDVYRFVREIWPCFVWISFAMMRSDFRRKTLAISLAVVALLVFFIFPEHIMGMAFRFLMPLYGPICLLTTLAILEIWNISGSLKIRIPIIILILGSIHLVITHVRAREVDGLAWYGRGMNQAHIPIGRAMAQLGQNHSVGVGDAGAIPYYSGWQAIDTFGLNDRTIAFSRFNGSYDYAYVLRQRPELLIFISKDCASFNPALPHEAILKNAAERAGYEFFGVARFASTYHLHLYARDAALRTLMKSAFNNGNLLVACTAH